jgi:hypothetical protein
MYNLKFLKLNKGTQWMQESDAFLLCYDITSEESLKSLDDICKTMWRTKEDDIDVNGNK